MRKVKRVLTKEHREKIRRSMEGKRKLKVVREKIAIALLGRKLSRATKEKMVLRELRKRSEFEVIQNHYVKCHESNFKGLDRRRIYQQCPVCQEVLE
jgi:hypothetical protein